MNGDYAIEVADVDDASQVIAVKLGGDDRTLWGPVSNPSAAGTTVIVNGDFDFEGYSSYDKSIEGTTQITAN